MTQTEIILLVVLSIIFSTIVGVLFIVANHDPKLHTHLITFAHPEGFGSCTVQNKTKKIPYQAIEQIQKELETELNYKVIVIGIYYTGKAKKYE